MTGCVSVARYADLFSKLPSASVPCQALQGGLPPFSNRVLLGNALDAQSPLGLTNHMSRSVVQQPAFMKDFYGRKGTETHDVCRDQNESMSSTVSVNPVADRHLPLGTLL